LTYADSGFVVSLYLTTEGTSAQARKEVKRASKPILLSPLSLLEIRNALNFGINRGEITSDQRDAVLAEIDAQIAKGFFRMVEASQSSIYAKAQELSNKHTPTIATRSLDLMHLAAALLSAARTFLTFDKRQAKAAAAEGLLVKPI
jgi:predicted nucleic acid-binding protein